MHALDVGLVVVVAFFAVAVVVVLVRSSRPHGTLPRGGGGVNDPGNGKGQQDET